MKYALILAAICLPTTVHAFSLNPAELPEIQPSGKKCLIFKFEKGTKVGRQEVCYTTSHTYVTTGGMDIATGETFIETE